MREDLIRSARWTAGIVAVVAVAVLVASVVWSPEAVAAGRPLAVVGLPPTSCEGCALCGMSRAFSAMSHLRPTDAAAFNPLVNWLYPAFWAAALGGSLLFLGGRRCAPRS